MGAAMLVFQQTLDTHKKNAQVVIQIFKQVVTRLLQWVVVDIWMCSQCVFPVVVTGLERVVITTLSQD
jgi:hypothetical protein